MKMTDYATEVLTIGKREYEVKLMDMNTNDLKFYPENPRVYSALYADGEPSQEEIEEFMCGLDHVKQLKLNIESNGGLIEPLIVRDGDFVVLEGNSRLAAYRLLCEIDAIKWGKVKCKLLPEDIEESSIFALLGQYHIVGKKDWAPFEQAGYLYRRQKKTGMPVDAIADELGIKRSDALSMFEVYTFMVEHEDDTKEHWSYYMEYLKKRSIKKYRQTNADIDDTIVNMVKSGEISDAKDMRKLAKIADVGDKQSNKFMQKISSGECKIDDAYSALEESGKLDDAVKKLKNFRQDIAKDTFVKQIKSSEDGSNLARFEIRKIIKRLEQVYSSIDKS